MASYMFHPPIVALKMATIGGQKNAGGYTAYNKINLYICIYTCWLYFSSVHGHETFKIFQSLTEIIKPCSCF